MKKDENIKTTLDRIDAEIEMSPGHLKPVDTKTLTEARELVESVEIDLDEPLNRGQK